MYRIKLGLVFILAMFTSFAYSADIEIFVKSLQQSRVIPADGYNIEVFDLSEPERIVDQIPMFSNDPKNPSIAMGQANAYFATTEGERIKAKLADAYRGHQLIVSYGVQKLPAVVFERGKFVVYGTTDIRKALFQYNAYKNNEY